MYEYVRKQCWGMNIAGMNGNVVKLNNLLLNCIFVDVIFVCYLHFLSSQSQALRPPAPKCVNVYVDPNVEEVIQCRPVLQQVVARVTELLQEWPDHPTLNQVSSLSFSS